MSYGDGYDSGDEAKGRFAASPRRLRRIEEAPPVAPEAPVYTTPWSYQAIADVPQRRRDGRYIDTDRFKEAIAAMEASLSDYQVPNNDAVLSPKPGTDSVAFELPELGVVESPGGSTVCILKADVCRSMNLGQVLEADGLLDVVRATKGVEDKFIASRLFDSFSGPWESILRSLDQERVLRKIVMDGEATQAFSLVDRLRSRFGVELTHVLANSNVSKRKFLKVFKRTPTVDSVMRAITRGDFSNISQTETFFRRVVLIKTLIDRVLLYAESQNVYLPNHISASQRMRYVNPTPMGSVGRGLHYPVGIPIRAPVRSAEGRLWDRMGGDPATRKY
jgi:hypothetical protein